ncbi:Hydroperoxy fatty acid reductase gpx1 [Roseibaca ekhonensis]|jgi:glutathione peroxidase|uniref:Glutathione peroxidase n=1 Tax=Roseinatronobacter ekhonensis TaxID=254356 RepID=A0A3B0M4V5_9RHOB|nr:glutathione peroxidase [Roseibaca ekhonensis]SUZ31062.1 Hydroperoxy fatty acid reductase gpx1 [Roseibaca ekhonensis]
MKHVIIALFLTFCAVPMAQSFSFTALNGDKLDLTQWRGQPVLVVNTASFCGFTRQYRDMQTLYDEYGDDGLVVLAVPSEDFNQEYSSNEDVAQFCRVETGLTFPIAEITQVRGGAAHPFYRWLSQEYNRAPTWNFNKALIGPQGDLLGFWGSSMRPTARAITDEIRRALP